MQLRILTLVFLIVGFCGLVHAQTASSTIDFSENNVDLKEITNQNWSVYADEDNQLFYIDFQNLTINISDIIVKDQSGRVVLKDDVFDLPVDTIYEIDLSGERVGQYEIELRSFTGIIRKTVSVK